jgi:hypothetical protein
VQYTWATIGERRQLCGVGSAEGLKVSADQHRDVGIGSCNSAEHLPAPIERLNVADANLQMPLAVMAAPDEG